MGYVHLPFLPFVKSVVWRDSLFWSILHQLAVCSRFLYLSIFHLSGIRFFHAHLPNDWRSSCQDLNILRSVVEWPLQPGCLPFLHILTSFCQLHHFGLKPPTSCGFSELTPRGSFSTLRGSVLPESWWSWESRGSPVWVFGEKATRFDWMVREVGHLYINLYTVLIWNSWVLNYHDHSLSVFFWFFRQVYWHVLWGFSAIPLGAQAFFCEASSTPRVRDLPNRTEPKEPFRCGNIAGSIWFTFWEMKPFRKPLLETSVGLLVRLFG